MKVKTLIRIFKEVAVLAPLDWFCFLKTLGRSEASTVLHCTLGPCYNTTKKKVCSHCKKGGKSFFLRSTALTIKPSQDLNFSLDIQATCKYGRLWWLSFLPFCCAVYENFLSHSPQKETNVSILGVWQRL